MAKTNKYTVEREFVVRNGKNAVRVICLDRPIEHFSNCVLIGGDEYYSQVVYDSPLAFSIPDTGVSMYKKSVVFKFD